MNNKFRQIIAVFFAAVFLLVTSEAENGRIMASSTDSSQDLQSQKEQVDQEKDQLEQAAQKLQDELGDMNSQINDISTQITSIEDQISETKDQIELAQDQLSQAESKLESQYESMKVRIKFMYENGGAFSWIKLFQAKDYADFINRAEYMTQVTTEDRKLLEEFKNTKEQIASYKEELENSNQTLLEEQAQLEDQQTKLLASISDLNEDMAENEAKQKEAAQNSKDLAQKIKAMEEYERQLDEQRAKEEDEKAKEEESTESDSSSTDSSSEQPADTTPVTPEVGEEELLAAIIYCEAGGESYEAQHAVGSVVINRVKSAKFPNTITGVIYQSGQFSPVASGKLALVLENNLTTDSCRTAANAVLNGDISGNWLFFRVNDGSREGTVIGKTVFY